MPPLSYRDSRIYHVFFKEYYSSRVERKTIDIQYSNNLSILQVITHYKMTDKKEQILKSALELFANEGVNATSTNKIAKHAAVSEGLIFRHYVNKKGLLNAIIQSAEEKASLLFATILQQEDAKAVIRKTIELPFSIHKSEYDFWKLQFKLKWEEEYNNPKKMQPLIEKLTWAFSQLNYENPDLEAQHLSQTFEAVSTDILKGNFSNQNEFKQFLNNKYSV
jgi:AcrR family transcriptional regulator